jgi:hypothetical protein
MRILSRDIPVVRGIRRTCSLPCCELSGFFVFVFAFRVAVMRNTGAFFEEFSPDSHAREGSKKGTRVPKKSGSRRYASSHFSHSTGAGFPSLAVNNERGRLVRLGVQV